MVSKFNLFIVFMFGLVAMLYQIDADTRKWEASEYANLYASQEQLERFITNPDSVEKWFQMVSYFRSADSRMLGVGKKYHAIYNLPLIGEYVVLVKVVEYKSNRLIVLESESLLKPRFTIRLEENDSKTSKLTFKMRYRRSSALFQWTLGPLFCFLTSQQLKHSLFMLRVMFPF